MKIRLHFTLIILLLLGLFTNSLDNILIVFTIIIIHEFGHIFACLIYKRRINEILFIPFGGIIFFEQDNNTPLNEEFLIYIFGPLMNLFMMIIFNLFKVSHDNYWFVVNKYVLLINLIPILPLDGGRILEIILSDIFNFKNSMKIITIFSIICTLLLTFYITFYIKGLNYQLLILFILTQNIKEYKNIGIRHQKFLLKKHLFPNKKLQKRKIRFSHNEPINHFYKGYNNFIMLNNSVLSENTLLNNFYRYTKDK